jgi:hypothetical protein
MGATEITPAREIKDILEHASLELNKGKEGRKNVRREETGKTGTEPSERPAGKTGTDGEQTATNSAAETRSAKNQEKIDAAIQHLADVLGVGVHNLIKSGILHVTDGIENWPGAYSRVNGRKAEAIHYNGKVYIDINVTTQNRLVPVLLHEIGEHYGLRRMLGTKAYEDLHNQIRNLASNPLSDTAKVWARVKREYAHLDESSTQFVAEVLARMGEYAPNAGWYRRLLAKVKSFLLQHGLARGFIVGTLNDKDIHDVLVASFNKSVRDNKGNEPIAYNGAPKAVVDRVAIERAFSNLENDVPRAERTKTYDKLADMPDGTKLKYIQDNFIDLLFELEHQGKVRIKC